MFTSARYTYAKFMYKCYIYIKSIGYTIDWEYIQKHNIILTKYLVKAIEYLGDLMSTHNSRETKIIFYTVLTLNLLNTQ